MPSALETYYLNQAKKKKTPEKTKEEAVVEFTGIPDIIKKKSPGFFIKLLDILDRPGNATRALLVGKLGGLKGLIPFAQTIENITGIDVALNEEELVRGTEVIEEWFGKQKQRKGKIDPVDVYGFLVEVIADPLWLIWPGATLTKAGRAAKIVKGAVPTMKYKTIKTAITAAKKGTPLPKEISKQVAKAFKTVYKSGQKPFGLLTPKSWAEQVVAGQRALLQVGLPGHRVTAIKGEPVIRAFEKVATKVRMSVIGKKFLASTKRVPTKYQEELHNIAVHFSRDIPAYEKQKYLNQMRQLFERAKKAGIDEKDLTLFYQTRYANAKPVIEALKAERPISAAKIQKAMAREKVLKGEAQEVIAGVTRKGELKKLAKEYRKIEKGFVPAERLMGLKSTELGEVVAHTRRVLTPEFAKWLKKNPRYGSAREFATRAGTMTRRRKGIAGMTLDEVNEYFFKKGFKGKKGEMLDAFSPSIAQRTLVRAGEHARVMGAAKTIKESARKFGKLTPESADWMPIDELMVKAGIAAPKSKRFIHPDIADALLRVKKMAEGDEFANLITSINRFYKGAFTIYWPAYHGRNAISNVSLNWIKGVINPISYIDAYRLQRAAEHTYKLMKKQNLPWDDAVRMVNWPKLNFRIGNNIIDSATFYDLSNRHGIVRVSLGEMGVAEVFGAPGITKAKVGQRILTHQTKVGGFARKVGMGVEDNARLAHFIEKTRAGFSPMDAAVSAKKVLFDYGDLSQFEKTWMRDRVFLFYTFARKNIALQTKTLFQQPAKQAVFAHLAGGTPQMLGEAPYYKDWEQERLMIPVGGQMIKGAGLPIEEAFGPLAAPGVGIAERAKRLVSRQLTRTIPAVKTPIELGAGRNLYFDRPIRDWKRWGLQQLPTARITSTMRSIRSPYQPFESRMTGLATGIRFRPYEGETRRQWMPKEIARRKMEQIPELAEYRRFYIPKKLKEKLMKDPKIRALLELQR